MQENGKITISQLAKAANVSVRTLQYYDKIGLLKPTSFSEVGGRLYNENDIALLHQIITLKSFGLKLEEIKEKLNPVNNSKDILDILKQQADIINEQISKANKILESIEMIKEEIMESKGVDWAKYSNMVKLINDNNEYYWVINYLEKDILNKISDIYENEMDETTSVDWLKECFSRAIELEEQGYSYHSEEAQELAELWWFYINKYTNGDKKLINQVYDFYGTAEKWPAEFSKMKKKSQEFIEKTIEHYLVKNNINMDIN